MGNTESIGKKISKILGLNKQEARVLMLGLDAAGKTTILYRMKLGEVVTTIPTIGFNIETIKSKFIDLTVWDVGGRDKIRPLYRHYYPGANAIIYVVDSNDRDRIDQACEEFNAYVLNEDELRDCQIIVLANKQDLTDAMSVEEVKKGMKLDEIRNRHVEIFPIVATTGQGLLEAFEYLTNSICKKESLYKIFEPLDETIEDAKKLVAVDQKQNYFFKNLILKYFWD